MSSLTQGLSNLRIGHKLYLGFGAVLAMLVVVVLVALSAAGSINQSAQDTYVEDAIPLKALSTDVLTQMVNEETAVRGYLVTGDKSSLDPYFEGRKQVQQN